jgi:adenylate kinase
LAQNEDFTRSESLSRDKFYWEKLKSAMEIIDISQGYIIQGYPRNIEQLMLLEINQIKYDLVIELYSTEEVILTKSQLREICLNCNISYNNQEILIGEYAQPCISEKNKGLCDRCGEKLTKRRDDKGTIVKKRYFNYQVNQELLKAYFVKKSKYLHFELLYGVNDFKRLIDEIGKTLEKNNKVC